MAHICRECKEEIEDLVYYIEVIGTKEFFYHDKCLGYLYRCEE